MTSEKWGGYPTILHEERVVFGARARIVISLREGEAL
jgi:hypothetical protein